MDYSSLGKGPISSDSAVGMDVRYEDSFETLQGEIDKLSNPTAEGAFQWETVANSGALILRDQSKDLLVASYLAVALVNLQSAKGLDFASQIYRDLLAEYWEEMYPPVKRRRGRIAAVEWWIDRTVKAIEDGEPGTVEPELAKQILARFEEINSLLETHLGDKVFLRPLIRAVDRYLAKGAPAEPEPESKPSAVTAPAMSAPVVTSSVKASSVGVDLSVAAVSLESADQVHRLLKPVFQKIAQGAKLLRDAAVSDTQSYAWLRFAVYADVKACPLSGVDGKTSLPAPPPQLTARLQGFHKNGSWKELLQASETALMNVQYRLWLDLHWYSATALKQLAGCVAALHAVEQGTLETIDRLDGLDQLTFSNEMPFASEDTKEWIKELKARQETSEDGTSGNALMMSASFSEELEEAVQEARSLAEDPKKIGSAMRILEKQISNSVSGKDALEMRLIMVELLAKARQADPAAALADLVLVDVERFGLREWDVPLAIRCHIMAHETFKKASGKEYKERQREVYQRILSMSAADALSL